MTQPNPEPLFDSEYVCPWCGTVTAEPLDADSPYRCEWCHDHGSRE